MGFAKLFLAAALALQVQSHMLLYKPSRYPSQDIPDNGPLNTATESTSNYPCKQQTGVYTFSFPRTQLPLGSNYTMQFQGQSVHGGGSCQISLSTDLEPTASSIFKVIHSFEGGCPARNELGNIPPDSNPFAIDPFNYDITIPDDIPQGDYTFAWTWFNRVGNREMYMNCAPVTVTGHSSSGKDASAFDALPNLFVANIPQIGCASPNDESKNMKFPVPGNMTTIGTGEYDDTFAPPTGPVDHCYAPLDAAGQGTTAFGGSPGKVHKGSKSSSSPSSSKSSPTPASSDTPASSATPASTATPASSPAPASTPAPYAPASSAPPASAPASSAPSTPAAVSTPAAPSAPAASAGSCPTGSVACSNPGGVVCVGLNHFGLCNINNCAVTQPLAAGTSCVSGKIIKKRSIPPHARLGRIYK